MSVSEHVGMAPSGRPAEPGELRPLEPDSIFRRFAGDWRLLLVAEQALVLQTAHPMIGAAVTQFSDYRQDPWGRLTRTLQSVML
jgi:uncharacterized protein (DUF2236 family)